MLANVLNRKCGSIWACSASMRASSTVRSSCSVSARRVASFAVSSALRLPPATTLMMKAATMSRKVNVGSLNMPPPMIRPRNETSSSAFHDTTATQSKNPHHITTAPLRISRKACRMPMGREAGPLLPGSAASSVPGLRWSAFILLTPVRLLVTGQDYGREPPGSTAA